MSRIQKTPFGLCALSLMAALALSACGGGGDGSSDSAAAGSGATLAITADNAVDLLHVTLASANAGLRTTAVVRDMSQAASARQVVIQQVNLVRALAARSLACSVAGTVAVEVVDPGANGLANEVGDAVTVTVTACDNGDGEVLDGAATFTLTQFTDDQHLTGAMTFTAFNARDKQTGAQVALDGGVNMTLDGSTQAFSIATLAVTQTLQGVAHAYTLSGVSEQLQPLAQGFSLQFSGQAAYPAMGSGLLSFSSTTAFVIPQNNPSQGVLRMTAPGGSAVLLTVLSETEAQISVDANGDGSYESVKTVNWTELL